MIVLNETHTTQLANSLHVFGNSMNLHTLFGWTTLTTGQFLHFFDSATLPNDGEIPIISTPIDANTHFSVDLSKSPFTFKNGLWICNSTTGSTKTIGAANCWINTQWHPN